MKRACKIVLAATVVAGVFAGTLQLNAADEPGGGAPIFTESEIKAILAHGPWPTPWVKDPSNRVSGKPEAIELGERLFFETRLSAGAKFSCATCHEPDRNWTDNQTRSAAHAQMDR